MVGVFGFLLGSFGIYSSNNDNSLQTDSVMAIGHLELVLKDADGNIKQYQQTDNLIVDIGFNTMSDFVFLVIDLNNNSTDSKFNVIVFWVGVTGPFTSDTGLVSPVSGCLNATATIDGDPSSAGSGALIFLFANFSAANSCTGTFSEAIIQKDLTDGEILSRQIFTAITIGSFDELDVFWDITLG